MQHKGKTLLLSLQNRQNLVEFLDFFIYNLPMKYEYFKQCIATVNEDNNTASTIGTYGEKTLHKVLKYYIEENPLFHEVSVEGYVADILNKDGIIEIQTRGFSSMEKKLSTLLVFNRVTLVYPICAEKTVAWVDLATGEVSAKRKSPKKESLSHALPELYKIRKHLVHPNLKVHIVVIKAEDYRYLNGWSTNRKRGSSRMERIPTELIEEYFVSSVEDLAGLIPKDLENPFTSNDFSKAAKLPISKARASLTLLSLYGAVNRIGKEGNKIIYERK